MGLLLPGTWRYALILLLVLLLLGLVFVLVLLLAGPRLD